MSSKIFKRLFCYPPKQDQGWCYVVFVSVYINQMLSESIINSFGILYPRLLKRFNGEEVTMSFLGASCSAIHFISCLVGIKICRVTSASVCCIIGSVISGAGLIGAGFGTDFPGWFITYALMHGFGSGIIYGPCAVVVSRWFLKYRQLLSGVLMSSTALGGLVLSQILQVSLSKYQLPEVMKCVGVIYIVLGVLLSCSYIPLEVYDESESRSGDINFRFSKSIFKNKKYYMWVAIMMLCWSVYFVPSMFLVKYATSLGIPTTRGSVLITILHGSDLAGRISFGIVANIFKRHLMKIYFVSLFLLSLSSAAAFFASNYWMLIAFLSTYGFLNGSFIGLISLVTLFVCGEKDFAQGWGILNGLLMIPIVVGPTLIGVLFKARTIEPRYMFLVSSSTYMLASIIMWMLANNSPKKTIEKERRDADGNDYTAADETTLL